MRIVIPICHSDIPHLPALVQAFKATGGFAKHSILLAPAPSLFAEAQALVPDLQKLCARVEVHSTTREPEGNWVQVGNWMFQDAVIGLNQRKNTDAFFWLPVDHIPTKAGWQDELETIHNGSGVPFLGKVRDLASVTQPKEEGRFMHLAGIYPANLYDLAQAEYHTITASHPFYISMRWRMFAAGVKEVDVFNYLHWTKGGAIAPPALVAPIHAPLPPFQEVSLEMRLLNDSYRQVMPGLWAAGWLSNEDIFQNLGIAPTPLSVIQHGPQGDPETGLAGVPHETLETENLPEPGADNAAPPVHITSEGVEPQGESSEAQTLAVPSGEPQTGQLLLDDLVLKVARHPKPERVGHWAEQLQMDKEALKSLINSTPGSGLKIAQAGWVTLSAAA